MLTLIGCIYLFFLFIWDYIYHLSIYIYLEIYSPPFSSGLSAVTKHLSTVVFFISIDMKATVPKLFIIKQSFAEFT